MPDVDRLDILPPRSMLLLVEIDAEGIPQPFARIHKSQVQHLLGQVYGTAMGSADKASVGVVPEVERE